MSRHRRRLWVWSATTAVLCALTGISSHRVAADGGAPADRLPDPRPEACMDFDVEPAEGEAVAADGLNYDQVTIALSGVIQTALYCPQPAGVRELHLTFEILVGCDGLVSSLSAVDDGGAPAEYVQCVSDVIAKADFPAHDMTDGMPVTYPVNVAW